MTILTFLVGTTLVAVQPTDARTSFLRNMQASSSVERGKFVEKMSNEEIHEAFDLLTSQFCRETCEDVRLVILLSISRASLEPSMNLEFIKSALEDQSSHIRKLSVGFLIVQDTTGDAAKLREKMLRSVLRDDDFVIRYRSAIGLLKSSSGDKEALIELSKCLQSAN